VVDRDVGGGRHQHLGQGGGRGGRCGERAEAQAQEQAQPRAQSPPQSKAQAQALILTQTAAPAPQPPSAVREATSRPALPAPFQPSFPSPARPHLPLPRLGHVVHDRGARERLAGAGRALHERERVRQRPRDRVRLRVVELREARGCSRRGARGGRVSSGRAASRCL
jgi:hypothetical protein